MRMSSSAVPKAGTYPFLEVAGGDGVLCKLHPVQLFHKGSNNLSLFLLLSVLWSIIQTLACLVIRV